uniref:Uncharacterized protein n=1 Tax=Triticum urartu TaxID=4572 RepID=A0A8R7Q6Z9_TRIUA
MLARHGTDGEEAAGSVSRRRGAGGRGGGRARRRCGR